MMKVFRTPTLAGKTTSHLTYASVRGNVRRLDPDMVSTVPYFPSITGKTLDITMDTFGPFTVTFTGDELTTVLADINAAIALAGAAGRAYDADGTVEIRSGVTGSAGLVVISGGDAGPILGLDKYDDGFPLGNSPAQVQSFAGEVASTPEGRVGNPFGTAFLTRGENFNASSVNRGLHALSRNIDVLYSDLKRADVVIEKATSVAGPAVNVQVAKTVYTGFDDAANVLTRTSTPQDLAPYFFLIDQATGLPAKSRVVGMGLGAASLPLASPPYAADATAWTGLGAAGNILGTLIDKVPSVAITAIYGGRVIQCDAANFDEVLEGDYVEITGATNLDQWSNNGFRWVVETAIDTTHIAVRPMSRQELALFGSSPPENQPVVALQDDLAPLQSYGNLIIRTGPFWGSNGGVGLNAVIDPPVPDGATYDLYVATSRSHRDSTVNSTHASNALFREFASNMDPTDNWTMFGFDAVLNVGNCDVSAGYIRWHGRVYRVPAQSFAVGDFGADGTYWVYWAEATGNLAVTSTIGDWSGVLADSYLSPTNKGHPVAKVVVSGGVISSVSPMVRRRAEKGVQVTAGTGGQFKTLEAAVQFVNDIATGNGESNYATGAYPHFEIVITSNLTVSEIITFTAPGILLRGAHPYVRLDTNHFKFVLDGPRHFTMRDLYLQDASGTPSEQDTLIEVLAGGGRLKQLELHNVWADSTGFTSVITTAGGGSISRLIVDNCYFYFSDNFVKADVFGFLRISNSELAGTDGAGLGGATHVLCPEAGAAGSFLGDIHVENCKFSEQLGVNQGVDVEPMIVRLSTGKSAVFRDVSLSIVSMPSSSNFVLFDTADASAHFENVTLGQGMISTVIETGQDTTLTNCSFLVNTRTGATAVTAKTAVGCLLTHVDVDNVAHGTGIGLKVTKLASGCVLNGPFSTAITSVSPGSSIVNNQVVASAGTNAVPSIGISLDGVSINSIVDGNYVQVTDADLTSFTGIIGGISLAGEPAYQNISNNKVYLPEMSYAGASTYRGILIPALTKNIVVTGNLIGTTGSGTFNAAQVQVGIDVLGEAHLIADNQVLLTQTGAFGIRTGATLVTFSSNGVNAETALYSNTASTRTRLESNTFTGDVSFASLIGGYLEVVGGRFVGVTNSVMFGSTTVTITGTRFDNELSLGSNSAFTISDCWIDGPITCVSTVSSIYMSMVQAASADITGGTARLTSCSLGDTTLEVTNFDLVACRFNTFECGDYSGAAFANGGHKRFIDCEAALFNTHVSDGITADIQYFSGCTGQMTVKNAQSTDYITVLGHRTIGADITVFSNTVTIADSQVYGVITSDKLPVGGGTFGSQHVRIYGNECHRMFIKSGWESIEITNNLIKNDTSNYPLTVYQADDNGIPYSRGVRITGNSIFQDNTNLGLGGGRGCIELGYNNGAGTTYTTKSVLIEGNEFVVTAVSPTAGAVQDYAVDIIHDSYSVLGLHVSGNLFRHPAQQVDGGHTWTFSAVFSPNVPQHAGLAVGNSIYKTNTGLLFADTGTAAGDRVVNTAANGLFVTYT